MLLVLNQYFFFEFCLAPHCLVAATPPVGVASLVVLIVILLNVITDTENAASDDGVVRPFTQYASAADERNGLHDVPDGILKGEDHYNYLIDSITQSTEQIIIMSGWLSSYVIDKEFLSLISEKLDNGVKIYIGYGYRNSKGEHSGPQVSEKVFRHLKDKYPKQFFLSNFATHEKLLIIDCKKVVMGSVNWLSNRNYINSERSYIYLNSTFVKSEAERAIGLIMDNYIPF